jgi:hypothetical protein
MPPVKENAEMVETINTAIPEEDRGQHEAEARMNSNIGDSALSTPNDAAATARDALQRGWSVILVRLDKRPALPTWKEYQLG